MPGITNRWGSVRITPYKMSIEDLNKLESLFLEWKYEEEIFPSNGFIGIPRLDEIGAIQIKRTENNNELLTSRFISDSQNDDLREIIGVNVFATLPERAKYVQSYTDLISFKTESVFVLVSTTSYNQLRGIESSCFNNKLFADNRIKFVELPDEFNCGSDFLVWLVYIMEENRGKINDYIQIRDIEYYYSDNTTHKISYSGRSSSKLKEMCSSIAQGRPALKLKILLGICDETYSFVLHSTGRTEIAMGQTSAYDEMEDVIGRRERIAVDIYNICIPELKKAYDNDNSWSLNRDDFRKKMKQKAIL